MRALESKHPILGLVRCDTPEEGLSLISILSTIVDFYEPGYRLCVTVTESDDRYGGKIIAGFGYVKIADLPVKSIRTFP